MDFTKISFPGVGIDAFNLKSVAFELGRFEVRWSAIIVAIGVLVALIYLLRHAKRAEGIKKRRTLVIALVAAVLSIVFARGAYVLGTLESIGYDSFGELVAIGDGLSFGGALVGTMLGILIMSDVFKIRGIRVIELFLPAIIIVQIFAAIGSFMDITAYGSVIGETTNFTFLGCASEFASGEGSLFALLSVSVDEGGLVYCYHPFFLYDFLWSVIGLVLVKVAAAFRRFDGQSALVYFAWFGLGATLRAGFTLAANESACAQWMSFIIAIVAIVFFVVRLIRCYGKNIAVYGVVAEKRNFLRYMTAEEHDAKLEKDMAIVNEILETKVDEQLEIVTAESKKTQV